MADTDTRKILFYDLRAYGRKPRNQDPPEIDLAPTFAAIKSFPATTSGATPSRYLPFAGAELLMEIFDDGPELVRGGFAIKRSRGLPRLEREGTWRSIRLEASEGLAFIRHFVYWKSSGLLGIEQNAQGPGIGALEHYLVKQTGDLLGFIRCEATVYLATDRFDLLQASDRISSASIGVKRESVSAVSEIDADLHDALAHAANSTNAQELRVEFLLGDRREDASLDLPFLSKLKSFVASPAKRKELTHLKARARDMDLNSMEVIDLLEDKFVAREEVVISLNGVVDQTSMLDAIVNAADNLEI